MFDRATKAMAVFGSFAALALGGSAIANATSSTSSSSAGSAAATAATAAAPAQPAPSMPAHGSAAHEDQEKAVTGDAATKAKAAAVKAIGGGTATDVTTDFTGDGYEVTLKQADGSAIEVHMDTSFNVVAGPGGGGPADGSGA